ncbi:MAG: hypothetical protein RMJ98_07380 [Myxococcales bacterium]|nr:hypothetical protein [Polyangiaceae bacterium]MDW8249107.1 hypothetical protein [Myxococcales bacterium]
MTATTSEATRLRRAPLWGLVLIPSVLLGAGLMWQVDVPTTSPVDATEGRVSSATKNVLTVPDRFPWGSAPASLSTQTPAPPPVSFSAEPMVPRPSGAARLAHPPKLPAEDCSPPYVIRDGIKLYKRNCLRR